MFFTKVLEKFADNKSSTQERRDLMKFNKIISLAVINGLTLLIFASLLASCQKNSIPTKGHFTKFNIVMDNNRSIASSGPEQLISLRKHFDLKQVYIYCTLNDTNAQKCYQNNLSKIINQYQQKIGTITKEDKKQIFKFANFKSLKHDSENIMSQLIGKMNTHIIQLVNKRENFCRVNSKYYIERCLKQYIESDTMTVLNKYQEYNIDLNGHEYLYLKNGIKKVFLSKLDTSFKKLQTEEKKS